MIKQNAGGLMFSIAEIAKTLLSEHFVPLTSWVYSKQITLIQGEILKIYIKKDVYNSLSIGDYYTP